MRFLQALPSIFLMSSLAKAQNEFPEPEELEDGELDREADLIRTRYFF